MSFETLIPFVIQHNALIIQGLVAMILFFVAFLAVRGFMRGADGGPGTGAGANLDQLEGTLKKLLEKANGVAAAPANADTARLAAEIETLRSSLAEKQDQIEQMKMEPKPAGSAPPPVSGLSDAEKAAMEGQIRDLQAKLAEYEIISEDIADLSFYKEENAKLQKALEGVKTAGVAAAPPPATAPPPAAAEKSIPVETASAPSAAAEEYVDPAQAMVDALMDTPQEQLQNEVKAPTADDEDLLKEFADAVSAQGGKTAIDESVADSLFDVERMTQEAGQLQKIAATAPEPDAAAMEAGLDADRLALEAASMEAIKPEDAKLMGDFEDFMKKGGA